MTSIPVVILSGFLGSGKTTLLLRLVHEARNRGLQPAILMNELGKLDIDGHIVQNELYGISVEKLLDGCICCDKKSEVAFSIETLIRRGPDVLFVELTGVANPEEIADCLTEPQLLSRVRLQQIITVLDAEHVLDYNSIFSSDRQLVHTLRRQMEVADLLLLNKTDLVAPSELRKIEKAARKQNPNAPIFHTVQSQMDFSTVFAGIEPLPKKQTVARSPFQVIKYAPRQEKDHHHHDDSAHRHRSFSRLSTVTLPCHGMIKPDKIERFLKARDSHILRAKGYLKTSEGPSVNLMQYAGKRISWQPSTYSSELYMVVIGIDLDTEQLNKEWLLLVDSPPA